VRSKLKKPTTFQQMPQSTKTAKVGKVKLNLDEYNDVQNKLKN
jgi:hypothetical protein